MNKESQKKVRQFLLQSIAGGASGFVSVTAEKFGVTRQTINRYLRRLVDDGVVDYEGTTSDRQYRLRVLAEKSKRYALEGLEEHVLWRDEFKDLFNEFRRNVQGIWTYGVGEMVNNAIDHSEGEQVQVSARIDAVKSEISIVDDGVGIFRKIKRVCQLEDERHAVLELAKGKLTTDPQNHTGEGIFFSSRMFDNFAILSGGVLFSHDYSDDLDWINETSANVKGTGVFMMLKNRSTRKEEDVFGTYAGTDDAAFTKTVVPVRLAKQGLEQLISRSQAKRMLARVDRFKTVVLDFDTVDTIGRAFADEVFRVFANDHPEIKIVSIRTNSVIKKIIDQVVPSGSDD